VIPAAGAPPHVLRAGAAGQFAREFGELKASLPFTITSDYSATLRSLPRDARPDFVRLCSAPIRAYVNAKALSNAMEQCNALMELMSIPRKVLERCEMRDGERRVEQVQTAILRAEYEVEGRDEAWDAEGVDPLHIRQQVYEQRHRERAVVPPAAAAPGAAASSSSSSASAGSGGAAAPVSVGANESPAVRLLNSVASAVERRVRRGRMYHNTARRVKAIVYSEMKTKMRRAASAVANADSTPLDASNPTVVEAVKTLFPDASAALDACDSTADAYGQQVRVTKSLLRRVVKQGANGAAPGPSGWTCELLQSLCGDNDCAEGLASIVTDVVNAKLPGGAEVQSLLNAKRLIALRKGSGGVRPIAMGEALTKVAGLCVMNKLKGELHKVFPDIQLGVGAAGGCEAAIARANVALCAYEQNAVLISTDISNAFGTRRRAAMMRAAERQPALKPALRMIRWLLSAPQPMVMHDRSGKATAVVYCQEGVTQGDVLSPLIFANSVQPIYQSAVQVVGDQRVTGVAIADDFSVIGKYNDAFVAFDRFKKDCANEGILLSDGKNRLLWPHAEDPPAELLAGCASRNIVFHRGAVELLGTAIGFDERLVGETVRQVLHSSTQFFDHLKWNSEIGAQTAVALLRQCGLPRMNYCARTVMPSAATEAYSEFDQRVEEVFTHRTGVTIDETVRGWFQRAVRRGGCGFRSYSAAAPTAFVAAAGAAVARMPAHLRTEALRLLTGGDGGGAAASSSSSSSAAALQERRCVWLRSLTQCYETVRASCRGARPLLDAELPNTVHGFIQTLMRAEAQKSLPKRIQHALTEAAECGAYEEWKDRVGDEAERGGGGAKAKLSRVLSASAPGASKWLTAVPDCTMFTLNDFEYRTAMGLAAATSYPSACSLANCRCGKALHGTADGISAEDHLLSCQKLVKRCLYPRHQLLQTALINVCRVAGVHTKLHPRTDVYVDDAGRTVRLQPDLTITAAGVHIITDVAVTHPIRSSVLSNSQSWKKGGVATNQYAGVKNRKYKELFSHDGYSFIPFVFDSVGDCHDGADRVLSAIARHAEQVMHYDKREFMAFARCALSVAIQRGNAEALRLAVQAGREVARDRVLSGAARAAEAAAARV
jgi:hypothetical protein